MEIIDFTQDMVEYFTEELFAADIELGDSNSDFSLPFLMKDANLLCLFYILLPEKYEQLEKKYPGLGHILSTIKDLARENILIYRLKDHEDALKKDPINSSVILESVDKLINAALSENRYVKKSDTAYSVKKTYVGPYHTTLKEIVETLKTHPEFSEEIKDRHKNGDTLERDFVGWLLAMAEAKRNGWDEDLVYYKPLEARTTSK